MNFSKKHRYKIQNVFLFLVLLILISSCNNKEPFVTPFKNIGGYVIGKETCNTDTTKDYWLIDFTYYPNQPQIGDTFLLNGITYTNVLKVKGLSEQLQQIGMRVAIDYNIVTPNAVISRDCDVVNPVTYPLKEIFIISQGEIR